MKKYFSLFILAALTLPVSAATWTVCKSGNGCNYTTINAAVQDSANVHCGDTVQIKAGQGDGNGSNGTPIGWYCGGSGSCNANNPVLLTQSCPANNRITLTSDQSAKLPPSNVRITPAYADGASPVVPTIYNPGTGMVLTAQEGNGGVPASGYNIVGIQFCCFSNFSEFIGLGNRGAGTADPQETVVSDIPSNIALDQVLIRTDPAKNTRKCISYDALGLDVLNSWIDCAYDESSSDSQGILGYMGNGKILNNYISGATETVATGGAMPPVIAPVQGGVKSDNYEITSMAIPGPIELAWNDITKPRWIYARGASLLWAASTLYVKGQMVKNSAGTNTPVMKAQNTCISGLFQPVWPGPMGGTVTDGSCTWKRTDVIDQAKNLFECKFCTDIYLHHNFFHRSWPQGQQGYAFTFTSSPSGTTQAEVNNVTAADNYIRDAGSGVNTSGQDTLNDLNVYPAIMTGEGPWDIGPTNNQLSFTINGNTINATLTNGSAQTATNVQADLTAAFAAAGVGLACLDNLGAVVIRGRPSGNTSTCGASIGGDGTGLGVHTITVHSVANDAWPTLTAAPGPGTVAPVEETPYFGCQNPRTLVWYGCGRFNNVRLLNNLWAGINDNAYGSGVLYLFDIAQHENGTQYSHNTVDALYGSNPGGGFANVTDAFFFPGVTNWMPFNVLIRDNVIGWRGNPNPTRQYAILGGSYYDFSCINFCFGQPSFADSPTAIPADPEAPAGIFSHNVLPHATLWAATTRNTTPAAGDTGFNSYPSDNYNSVPVFDAAWRLTNSPGPGTDLTPPGADPSTIPRILNANIRVSDRAAVLRYKLTEPVANSGYGCAAYVTTKDSYFYTQPAAYDRPDSAPVVADMDPSLFSQPDWDGNDKFPESGYRRSIVIGLNQPLSPSTTYYLRLLCPGASWPEDGTSAAFTTLAAESGTRSIAVQRVPQAGIGAIATMRVTYGTGYSRSTGIVSGGGEVSESCSAGSACTVEATAARGVPLYTQVQYLDAGSSVLFSEPVGAPLLP